MDEICERGRDGPPPRRLRRVGGSGGGGRAVGPAVGLAESASADSQKPSDGAAAAAVVQIRARPPGRRTLHRPSAPEVVLQNGSGRRTMSWKGHLLTTTPDSPPPHKLPQATEAEGEHYI